MKSWLSALLLCLALAGSAQAQQVIYPPLGLKDEGTLQGRVLELDCTGAGVSCSVSGITGTVSVSGGGGGAPDNAQYWVGAPDGTLSAEKDLSALSTGLVINTAGTPSAYAGGACSAGDFISALSASGALTCGTPSGSGNVTAGATLTANQLVLGAGSTAVATLGSLGTTTTVLHGNAAGNPSWGAVSLTADVSGDLPFANLAQGDALSVLGVTGNATADVASIAAGSDKQVLRRSGTSLAFGAIDIASSSAVTGTLAVANGGTGLTSGTSGGVLAFTASGTLASSGALTANLPVIGGGAGVAPTVGTRSGNTTSFATTSGTLTSGNCAKFDANGNVVDHGSACGGGGSSWTEIVKSADESVNSGSTGTTLQDDAELLFSLAASTNYIVEMRVAYSTIAAADIKWAFTGPASPTRVIYGGRVFASGAAETDPATAFGSAIVGLAAGTEGFLIIQAVIENGSNTGNLTFQWAQNTANAGNTTVRKGSYLRYRTF